MTTREWAESRRKQDIKLHPEEYKTSFEMVEELVKAVQAILPIEDNENLAQRWGDEFDELRRTLDALTRQDSGVFFQGEL